MNTERGFKARREKRGEEGTEGREKSRGWGHSSILYLGVADKVIVASGGLKGRLKSAAYTQAERKFKVRGGGGGAERKATKRQRWMR